ncbi:MAG: putative molybdenum carrier protein [Desulfobacterales bacterium]
MVKKIISGGQTGADRAALDFAIKFDIPHGGWIVKGRMAEDGILDQRYMLQEIHEFSYPKRTLKNVLDSDGTLIISHGPLTGGSDYTRKMAVSRKRPCLHIDLLQMGQFQAAEKIRTWIFDSRIEILNIGGPRQSKDSKIYDDVMGILEGAFFLDIIHTQMPAASADSGRKQENELSLQLPQTIDQAAEALIFGMSFGDRAKIANLSSFKLKGLAQSMSEEIVSRFLLGEQNPQLVEACREAAGNGSYDENLAVEIILEKVWEKLRSKKNVLKVVKS